MFSRLLSKFMRKVHRTKASRLLVLGDSHVQTIKWAADNDLFCVPVECVSVGGATAVGMRNPNSLTNALQIFEQAALPYLPGTVPVIQLGEVDCGFVIWWRSMKHGETIDFQIQASIGSYFSFVDRLLAAGYPTLIITGATLPTIQDGQDRGEVANLRKEVMASIRDRTTLTRRYNQLLQSEAQKRNLPFVDISERLIDAKTGVVHDEYRHTNPLDHHMAPERVAPLWVEALSRHIL